MLTNIRTEQIALPRLGHMLRRLRDGTAGVAAVEFALAMPILAMLLLGGLEISRYVLLNQKLSRLAINIGDLVTRAESLTEGDMLQVFQATQFIIRPFDFTVDGNIIVTSVGRAGTQPATVNWQRSGPGAGGTAASTIGLTGKPAALPNGVTLREDQDVIITEVFYDYQPFIIGHMTTAKQLYQVVVQRPRFGSLVAVTP